MNNFEKNNFKLNIIYAIKNCFSLGCFTIIAIIKKKTQNHFRDIFVFQRRTKVINK